ncbi:hypothetical protein [Methylovirgula sp. 4M-Z18]|uniref:hypothetical protein n=1 Tax=Methylovirgula sp. 4M-Z18 TaxID=2293567 RepID=UPI000E2E8873|nr:hypothetical protein [Methylovirgula sp. 4M-Z18]RFB79218.1 hypothetical protein DYH55_11580 [Methylovirgula sp. 4M-Z18]
MTQSSQFELSIPAIPSAPTLLNLFIGGYISLMAWEIWSRIITVWVVGNPLEPPGLVLSLVNRFAGTNYDLSMQPANANATAVHYFLGIVGYPVLYYIVSRGIKHWAIILDAGVWLLFTGFVVLSLVWWHSFTQWMGIFWLLVTLTTATRFINPNPLIANCLSWGSYTWFNALGIFAPVAGLPFLLMDWGGDLSFMSWVGHMLFGFLAALVFEKLEARQR